LYCYFVTAIYHWKIPDLNYVYIYIYNIYIHHTRSPPPHHTTPRALSQSGESPIYIAAYYGHTGAVKELIAGGCDVNLANKVQQMTRLALALACLGFRVRLPLPPLAHLNLQYSFRLLLESLIPGRSSTGKIMLHVPRRLPLSLLLHCLSVNILACISF
jgi:hypothetical protein